VKILFVDNHPEFTSTVIECFLREDEVVVVPTVAAAKECIQASRFDVVLVDYDLDDGKGDEFVRWLRPIDPNARVVAVSARDLGNEALIAAGANTVCAKTSFARIQTVLKELAAWPTRRRTSSIACCRARRIASGGCSRCPSRYGFGSRAILRGRAGSAGSSSVQSARGNAASLASVVLARR